MGCATIAAKFPVGNVTDTAGNTAYCRLYHIRAGLVAGDLVTHCPHAAPHGGTVCGGYPENYCQLITTACTTPTTIQYTNAAACAKIAPAFTVGTFATDQSTNSLACRTYHAKVALGDAATHCVHAGVTGGGACGTTCPAFCALIKYACVGSLSQYADDAACLTACGLWAPGTVGATTGNTLACRFYHIAAGLASGDNVTHCPHGSVGGGGVMYCGSAASSSAAASSANPATSTPATTGSSLGLVATFIVVFVAMLF
jgi:hypothetical protein